MRTSLLIALAGCGAVFGWSWGVGGAGGPELAAVHSAKRAAGADAPLPQPDSSAPRRVPEAPPVAPVSGDALVAVIAPPLVYASGEAQPQELPYTSAELMARRAFHAQVVVEEFAALLPPEGEAPARTPEHFPGYFAAVEQRDHWNRELARVAPPAANERLPALDLDARADADFERVYGGLAREDLLVENWLLSRSAYAESRRLLDELIAAGPHVAEPRPTLGAFG